MALAKSLEAYIKKIVNKHLQEPRNSALSDKSIKSYSEALAKLVSKAETALPSYGKISESLADSGLQTSGYKDYIATRVKNKLKNSQKSLEDEKAKADAEELLGYESYLKKRAEETKKLKDAVLSFASKSGISDYETLYEYARDSGLDEADAEDAAKYSSESIAGAERLKSIEKVQSIIIAKHFTEAQAFEYAVSLGLSEEDARALADFAYKINQNPEYIVSGNKKQEKQLAINADDKLHTRD